MRVKGDKIVGDNGIEAHVNFREVKSILTLRDLQRDIAFIVQNKIDTAKDEFEDGTRSAKDEAMTVREIERWLAVRLQWECFFDSINGQWNRIECDGMDSIDITTRLRLNATLWNCVNLCMSYLHFTLSTTNQGIFFNTISQYVQDEAASVDSSKYPIPKRCRDDREPTHIKQLWVMSGEMPPSKSKKGSKSSAGGSSTNFASIKTSVQGFTQKQRQALIRECGGSNSNTSKGANSGSKRTGSGKGVKKKPRGTGSRQGGSRQSERLCYNCNEPGHKAQDCTKPHTEETKAAAPGPSATAGSG